MKYIHHKLPSGVIQATSEIHGVGLFTTVALPPQATLGQSHVIGFLRHLWCTLRLSLGNDVSTKYYRTYLGSIYNHSETPNCVKVWNKDGYALKTLRYIKAGEELTVNYTFYTP